MKEAINTKKRSTSWLVCSVIAAHGLAVCLVLLIQGCGTPISPDGGPATTTSLPSTTASRPMPPRVASAKPVVRPIPPMRKYTPPVVVPSQSSEYVVKKGDSLSVIASRFNVTVTEIMALNQIKQANKIRIGQTLILPGKIDLSAPAPKRTVKPTRKVAASGPKYVVKPGDTLSHIAVAHGIKTADLRSANGISGDVIYVGQSLVVPGGKLIATTTVAKVTPKPVVTPTPKAPVVADVPTPVAPGVPPQTADPVVAPVVSGATDIPLTLHTHEVKDGEDLYSVSLIWDVSIDELKRVNGLSGTDLTPGQVLRIPRVE
ncbi:MAG: LysM peptidoglycan-binding domain-containing protein [Kiritimatiellae bacterium]|nr:LysM peptidoglycan-binding domain-containing protein [Kiritimatiellia bacterium]